ncbi:AP-1 complex-associated regulatory protein-like [Oscarella lobularis]|uniref:AP-1 complex-associated regulatory protein-like n=1 Tax=Oscarella lobularis TaxID=121494 RepID=UPI00331408BD
MGSCGSRCFNSGLFDIGGAGNRAHYKATYSQHQLSIEVDALLEADDDDMTLDNLTRPKTGLVTDEEAKAVAEGRYDRLVQRQRELDAEYERRMAKQEEDLRLEEEAYYEAKRAAARAAQLDKERKKDAGAKKSDAASSSDAAFTEWLNDPDNARLEEGGASDGDDVQKDVEDFEMFLEAVKKRSLANRSVSAIEVGEGAGDGDEFTEFDESVAS